MTCLVLFECQARAPLDLFFGRSFLAGLRLAHSGRRGNASAHTIAGVAYTQSFDYDMVPRQRDNRLTGVAGGSVSATFLYDAEGNRVKGTIGGVTTVYIAGLYEYQNGAVTKYYEGGALRRTGYATDNGVFYVVSDHLRSTGVLVNRNGTVKSRNFYYPYGGNRGGSAFSGVTTKRFTGQYHEQGLPGGEGLSYYNARWYDAQVGMFISADTLVPSPLAPQAFNRYAYVGGNPLLFVDPSGHNKLCGAACEDAYNWSPPRGSGGGGAAPLDAGRVMNAYRATRTVRAAAPAPVMTRTVVTPRATSVVQLPRTPVPTLPFRTIATATPVAPRYLAAPTATPTPGTFLNAYTGPTATPSGYQAAAREVNWPAWSWGASFGLLYEVPAEMMERGLTGKYLTKGALRSVPIVGVSVDAALSAGPNLIRHMQRGDPLRETGIDLAVDLGGVAASQFGGAVAGVVVGGRVAVFTKSPQAGALTAIGVSFGTQLVISPFWDLEIGPNVVRPWLESVVP